MAKFANIDVDLRPYKVGQSKADKTVERKLPSDREIESIIDGIQDPRWRCVFARMAIYGLRNHEAFLCTLETHDGVLVANVPNKTKTGSRIAYPHPAKWIDRWLSDNPTPPNIKVKGNSGYGDRTASYWRKINAPGIPYDLRHAYASRCHLAGAAPAIAAQWMGHTPERHMKTYQRLISTSAHQQAWQQLQQISD